MMWTAICGLMVCLLRYNTLSLNYSWDHQSSYNPFYAHAQYHDLWTSRTYRHVYTSILWLVRATRTQQPTCKCSESDVVQAYIAILFTYSSNYKMVRSQYHLQMVANSTWQCINNPDTLAILYTCIIAPYMYSSSLKSENCYFFRFGPSRMISFLISSLIWAMCSCLMSVSSVANISITCGGSNMV